MLRCRTESCRILKQFSNQHHESEKTDAQNSKCLLWGNVTKRPEVEQNDATVNEQTGDLLVITCPQQSPYIQANLKVFFSGCIGAGFCENIFIGNESTWQDPPTNAHELANEKPAEFFHAIRQVSSPNFGRFSNFQNAILNQLFGRQMNTFHLSIDQFSKLGWDIG